MKVEKHAWAPPDPSITAVVPRHTPDAQGAATETGPPTGQGQLFADAYPTFADTDQLPAVAPRPRPHDRAPRWLRIAVVVVAIALLAASAALGLVASGVLKGGSPNPGTASSASSTPSTSSRSSSPHPARPRSTSSLVAQTSVGSDTATYTVANPIYTVIVNTTTGQAWVSAGALGQNPQFAGILQPDSSQKVTMLGPSTVEVGAGGTTVTVAVGKRSATLTPPSAPFTYQFVPKKS